MKIHPVAELFPMFSAGELRELSDDIKANGLQQAIVIQDGALLDGRNRLAACELAGVKPTFTEYAGESPVAFIIGVNLHRRHLSTGQKVALAIEIEPFFAKEAKERQIRKPINSVVGHVPTTERSRDRAASAVGLSGKTVSAAKAIKKTHPKLFKLIMAGKLTVAKAKKMIKADNDRKQMEQAAKEITVAKEKSLLEVFDVRHCSCAELFASGIKPDAVITDPPYPEKFLPVFSELAEACKDVPLVAVMVGQSYLPEVLRRLCEHLKYRWTLAYLTPGGQAVQQFPAKVNTFWKPVLLFGKAVEWIGDVTRSDVNANDKEHHHWGQSESGMADLVSRLTKPGHLIADPFVGGGTTAIVALALNRRFVGCDVESKAVQETITRAKAAL
jgi:site-specific DNA-methyltransferase (adenine-specific)